MSKINKKSGKQQATTADIEQEENLLDHQTEQQMRTLRNKHPDCIPILFSRHKAAPKSLKQPSVPFMLFKKDLKIEQAMYRLYQQIEQKGLYFFCLEVVKDKAKYRKIQAGPTIEQIYNKYGKNECLILIYGNSEMGLEGLQRMQKCMIWLIVIVGTIWLSLFLYNYFYVQGPQAQIKQQTLQP